MLFLSILGIGAIIVAGGSPVFVLFKRCGKNLLIAAAAAAVSFFLFQNIPVALAVGMLTFIFGFFI